MIYELLELFIRIITLNENMVLCQRAACEAGIPGQDDAVLLECKADDLVVVGPVVVQDVVPEEAHSLGELAEHDISDELHK